MAPRIPTMAPSISMSWWARARVPSSSRLLALIRSGFPEFLPKPSTTASRASRVMGYKTHGLSRPVYSETLAIAEVYEIGALTGCRSHIVHCSTGRGYELCAAYRSMGHRATIEACLHYLVLS